MLPPLRERWSRDEPRSVRFRRPRCWFLLLAQVFPTAMPSPAPHHRACARCIVRIDVHGSPDRVKDASPEHLHGFSCLCRVRALFFSRARRHSPPRRPKDIRCHRRDSRRGGTSTNRRADRDPRSGDVPRRKPLSRRSGCLGPHRTRRYWVLRKDCSLRSSRRLSRSRRPHSLFPAGRSALDGHCKVTVRSPASP